MDSDNRRKRSRRWLWWILLLGAAVAGVVTWRVGPPPAIEILPELPGIGRRTPVLVTFEEQRRGLARIRVELVQGDRVEMLAERDHQPRPPWKLWGPAKERDVIELEVGSETIQNLKGGEATLRASAWRAGTWLRRPPPAIEELALPVRLTPPALQLRSRQHYVSQGGAGVVVYSVGKGAVKDGVAAGDWWFPGHALPGTDAGLRFALFGVPFDLEDASRVVLVAEDDVGNRAVASFVDRYFARGFERDRIEISDRFMEKVVPAIMASTPEVPDQGGLLENYLWINSELRQRNAQTLRELGKASQTQFLWSRPFVPMANAQVMSSFADRRTYVYEGREVDRQDHLGFDLASVRHADVQAANQGVVVLARYFGIYGNAVAIDHGYGLLSLYGHLSSFEVAEGESVQRGQVIGRSGETGLAGGDHLHFTLLVRGLPVNPVEWWDGAWIRDRFAAKLGDAFQLEP